MITLREFTASIPRPLPVLLLADVSGSMSVDGKIDALNVAVAAMLESFEVTAVFNPVLDTRLPQNPVGKMTVSAWRAACRQDRGKFRRRGEEAR